MADSYLHGYSGRESQRLQEQSRILEALVHDGLDFEPPGLILEAGSGVGAQSRILLERNPDCRLLCVDREASQLHAARQSLPEHLLSRVSFQCAALQELCLPEGSVAHVFLCFVLEHLSSPVQVLRRLGSFLRPGGTLTAIEGDHEPCVWWPHSDCSRAVWNAMIESQRRLGHDPCIGRQLQPLLEQAGLQEVSCEPRVIWCDNSRPELRRAVLEQIIVPMTETARDAALRAGLLERATWEQGIAELTRLAEDPATFFYTWFRAVGVRAADSIGNSDVES
jgi:SAM-dependent methyltransferase